MSCVSCGRGSNYIWCKVQRVNTMCTLHLIFPIIFLIVFPDNFHFYPHKGIFNMSCNCIWIKEWSVSTSEFQFLAKLLKTCSILFPFEFLIIFWKSRLSWVRKYFIFPEFTSKCVSKLFFDLSRFPTICLITFWYYLCTWTQHQI